jgi:hypothetical protein
MATRPLINIVCILVVASGCGAEKTPEKQAVGTSEDELSFSEQCESVSSDGTWTGDGTFRGWTRNYDHAGCRHAFVLDFTNIDADGGLSTGQPSFTWNEAAPNNQVECERARILVYSWDQNGNRLDARAETGFWWPSDSTCSEPQVYMPVPTFDQTTRYAISARQGLASGNYSKRKVKAKF